MRVPKITHIIFFALAVGFLVISHYIFDDYSLRVLNNIAIFIILAVSYNLINGVTGQFSLEPNGFVAVGAYVAALILLDVDAKNYQFDLESPSAFILWLHSSNFLLALLAAGVCATILALVLSFPVFRVRGDYLAIVTLGFGFIIKILAINYPSITNGSLGLSSIPQHATLYYTGGIAIIGVIVVLNIVYSKFGRAMKAVRDDEDAALAMGVNTFAVKTTAFSTSAFLEGVGGGLWACSFASIVPNEFDFYLTFQLLIIIVLGGLGSMTGAILGTILVIGGGEWLRFLDESLSLFGHTFDAMPGLRMIVFSVILILVMLFAREGIFGKKELTDVARSVAKRLKR